MATAEMQETASFDYSAYDRLQPGMIVRFWPDPTLTGGAVARILDVAGGESATVWYESADGGYGMQTDCMLRGDPRITEKPHLFDDRDAGIIEVVPWCQILTDLPQWKQAIEDLLSHMPQDVEADLKNMADAIAADMKSGAAWRKSMEKELGKLAGQLASLKKQQTPEIPAPAPEG